MKDKLKALLITSGLFALGAGVVYSAMHWPNQFLTAMVVGVAAVVFIAVYNDILSGIKDENN